MISNVKTGYSGSHGPTLHINQVNKKVIMLPTPTYISPIRVQDGMTSKKKRERLKSEVRDMEKNVTQRHLTK